MEEYALIIKDDESTEIIARVDADSKENAILYFSKQKKIESDELVKIFGVVLVSSLEIS